MPHPLKAASATLVAVLLAAFSPNSKAWAAAMFTGNSSGTFGTPTIDASVDAEAMFNIEQPSEASTSFILGEPGEGSMPNQLTFTGKSFSAPDSQAFSIGDLSYTNGQTFRGTNVSSVPIEINLDFAQPTQVQQQIEYNFAFDLTPNTDIDTSADNLEISANPAVTTVTSEPESFSLELLGFSQDNGSTFTRNFQVREDQTVSSQLYAIARSIKSPIDPTTPISPKPTDIPEPTMLAGLFLLGSAITLTNRQNGSK